MAWEPDLIDALDNLLARRDELEAASQSAEGSATPSYWIQREADAYGKARDMFMKKIDERVDARVSKAIEEFKSFFKDRRWEESE